ncbi:MAG: dipeptidase [Candidatus Aminicenantales bacterium]
MKSADKKNFGLVSSVLLLLTFGFLTEESCRSELTEEKLSARARELHQRILTVDTHCDTPMMMVRPGWDIGVRHEPGLRESGKVDLIRMKEGGLDALFFGIYVAQGPRTPEGYAKAYERAKQLIAAVHSMVKDYPQQVALALKPEDAYSLKKEGKRAAFMGMENGYPLGLEISRLKEFYDLGIRYLTLCHSQDNDICDSSTDWNEPEDKGLSAFGREVVAECNRLGIMVDVSHISDKSFWDVLDVSQAPPIASHSSCRALCDSPRNLSDEMIKALARKGGVIQICFLSSYLRPPRPNPERDKALQELEARYGGNIRSIQDEGVRRKAMEELAEIRRRFRAEMATVRDVVDHVEHVIKLVGIDYVGIGTDFDGGGGVDGCNDVSEMYRVTVELLRRGYGEKEIAKVWGGNIMRVFRQVIETSRRLQAEKTGKS